MPNILYVNLREFIF